MYKVKDLMTKKVVTIPEDIQIQQICNILIKNSLSGLPVVDNQNKLIGFVSERDVVAAIGENDSFDVKAKAIMRKKVITVKEDATLAQLVKIFSNNHFRHLPVVKENEVVGIISRKDIMNKLLVP